MSFCFYLIDVKLDRVTVVGHFKLAAAESLGEYLRPLGWQKKKSFFV
ncbi:MAG: hypothetical protein ACTH45_06355 [Lactobacillus helveticus]